MDNREQLATKQDLAGVEQRVEQRLSQLETRVDQGFAEIKEGFAEMREFVRDTETKLLTAFYASAESTSKHFTQVDRASASLDERLGTFERRILDIERRLNMPGA